MPQALEISDLKSIDLRQLSELEGPVRAFLSVYVSGEAGLNGLDDRLDRLRSTLEDEPTALEHFEENVQLVRRWLEEYPPGDGSACVFAGFAADLCRGWRFDFELPDAAHVGMAPWVRPLAELQDEYETFAVVTADNRSTRVYLVTSTEEELAGSVRGDVKNHVKKGGWSQKRYQRRRENQLQHYADDVVALLEQLDGKREFDRIVMLGSEETLVALEERLGDELAGRVVAMEGFDLHRGKDQVIEAALELFEEAQEEAERDLWREIRAEVQAGGLAVLGATDVFAAVQTGRAEEIVVERERDIRGTRCQQCEHTVHGTPASCQSCGSKSVVEIALVNAITRLAETTSASVTFVDPIPGLSKAGGIAALLRY